jgi:hypothetical protein
MLVLLHREGLEAAALVERGGRRCGGGRASAGCRSSWPRAARRLAQEDLAAQTGRSTHNIRAYEYDEKRPTNEQLARLVVVLGEELVSGLGG